MKKIIVYLLVAASVYCSEIDFTKGTSGELLLQPKGKIRVRESFKIPQAEKEIVITNLSRSVDRDSLIVESEDVEEFILDGDFRKGYYLALGENVFYRGEKYRLLSEDPLTIENIESGEWVINPDEEIRVKPLVKEKGINLTLHGNKEISVAKINYSLEGLTWSEEYYIYLDKNSVKKNIFLNNDSDKNFENISVIFPGGNRPLDKLDLKTFTGVNKNIFYEKAGISKNYIYLESREKKNPELSLGVEGLNIASSDKVKVFDEKGYRGEFTGVNKNGELEIRGLLDQDIRIDSSEIEKNLGTRLKQRKVSYFVKNYKKEDVILKIFYDKLPEKWNELRSEEVYEMIEKTAVFTLRVAANSRKDLKFSFIEEKN
ncbi:hypothetical protein [uncultured Ilyobacter sp.]|uniref:hypothetical protein n=1 Tax=uncultured Ilyobacter sp. TaxID=544433 RepID=UPI0029C07AA0|nr:hypothetical protein [uncultured Ilyobacter sp.]